MKKSRVLAAWREGKVAIGAILDFADPYITEMICERPFFDCVWLDLEHTAMTMETFVHLSQIVRLSGRDIMARPANGELMRMGRMLEYGANGILYPRCESVEDARALVRWAKFPPQGERGFTSSHMDTGYGYAISGISDYLETANREIFLAAMVESPAAAKITRQLASVDGIDMIFFGPGDYSSLSGIHQPPDHPEILRACEQVCQETHKAGKRFGTLCFNRPHMKKLVEMGADFIVCYSDIVAVNRSLETVSDWMQELNA